MYTGCVCIYMWGEGEGGLGWGGVVMIAKVSEFLKL